MTNDLLKMAGLLIGIYIVIFMMEHVLIFVRKASIHVKRWNKWRKRNTNGKLHKFLVLIGLQFSPNMSLILTDEEIAKISILKEDNNESL